MLPYKKIVDDFENKISDDENHQEEATGGPWLLVVIWICLKLLHGGGVGGGLIGVHQHYTAL